MENRRKIIMDCDPGIDDAVALCLAAAHPEAFEILGITTVAGNQTIDKVTANALKLVDFYGLQTPVAQGASQPLVRDGVIAPDIHGKTGVGNYQLPDTDKQVVSDNAVEFMYQLIKELPEGEKVTLVPTGPLTNIALLFKMYPQVLDKIEEVVLMGGAAFGGNVTPCAEFNIYDDPEAASIVFKTKIPIVMCGLDATSKCGITRKQAEKLCQSSGKIAQAVGEMVAFYLESPAYELKPMACIHDAVTFMYMLHPEIYKTEKMPVGVNCNDGPSLGMTICDSRWWLYEEEDLRVTVLMDADEKEFQRHLIDAVFELDEKLR